ncbi:MAG: IclR family transcriptional regulator C-terminal domain-containing protein [Pseudorhodoplanes sp.]
MTQATDSETYVRAFARGLSVIGAMGRGAPRKTIAEIADAIRLPRSVVKRLLLTLCEERYVVTNGRSFALTPKVLSLGLSYLYTQPYWPIAQPALEDLRSEVGESCSMGVLHGTEIVYVLRIPSRRILAMNLNIGSRLPAHQVSIGRVLLAALPEPDWREYVEAVAAADQPKEIANGITDLRVQLNRVQQEGYAWVDGALDPAIAGLAVPVRDATGEVIAAINVSLIAGTCDEAEAVRRFLVPLRRAAEQIRASMPWEAPGPRAARSR